MFKEYEVERWCKGRVGNKRSIRVWIDFGSFEY